MVRVENISDSSYEHLNPDDATNIKNNDGPSLEPSGKIDEDKEATDIKNDDGPSLEPSGKIDKDKKTKTNDKDKMDENTNSSRQSHLDTDLGRIHITEEETVIEDIDYVTEIENEDLKEVKTVITEERKLLSDGEECITYVVTTYIVHEPESFKDLLSDDDEDTFYTIPNDDTDIDLSLDDDDETTQDENVVPEIVDDVFFIPKGVKAQNIIADDDTKEENSTKISSDEVKPRKIPKLSADMNIRIPKETASLSGEKECYNLTPITPVEVIDFPFGEDDEEKEMEAPVNKKCKTDIEIIEISSDEEDSNEQKVDKNSDFEDVSEESNPMQENTTGLKIVEIKHAKDEEEESKGNISQNIEIIVISSGDEDSLETDFSKIGDADSHIDNSDTNSIVEGKTETIIISSDEEKEDRIVEMCYEEENKQPQSSENPIYIIENDIIIVDISDEEDSLEENNRVNLKTELEQAVMYQKENNEPEFKEEGEENGVDKHKTPFDVIKIIDHTETTVENEGYSEDSLEGETDKNIVNNTVITPGDENTSENKSLNEIEVKKEADVEESESSKAIDSTITPFENIKVEIKLENPIQDPLAPIEVVIHAPDNETSENLNNEVENLESKEVHSGKKSPFTIIYVPDEDTSRNDTKEESNTTIMNKKTGSVKDITKNQSNNETDFEEIDVDNYLEKNVGDTNTIDKNMNAATNLNDRNKENVHSSFCDVDVVGNNKEVARENKDGGRIDFVKSNQEKIMTPIEKEILFDMGNIKQDVLRNEIQIENQEENNETQEVEIEDNIMNVKEDNERNKEDDQNIRESSEDEDTLDNIPEIEIDCSESNEQSAHLDVISCNDPEDVLMVNDDAMDNNADTAIIDDQEYMEDNQDTKTNPIKMSFVDEVVMMDEYIKEDDEEKEAAMEIDMDENVNTKDPLKTKNYPNNQNLYDKENVPPIQSLENQTKKDKLSQTSIGHKDVEFVVEKCMIDLIDLITTLGMKNKENYDTINKENDQIVACVQNKIDEIQSHPDKNMKKEPVKLSKYQQFENTPFLAIGRNIVTRKPNAKRVRKGKKKTKENKKENETLDDQVSKDVPILTENIQSLVKPIEEESKEELTLYYPLGNESDVSIYPIILDFEQNEIEVADTVPLMNESDDHNESLVEEDFERKKSESSEKEDDKSEENRTESFCLDLATNEEENTEKEELESANTAQTDNSSDPIPENTEDIKTEFSSDDPLIEENSNTFSSMTIIDSNTFSSMTIIDSIVNDTQSISREPLIIEDENSLDQMDENEASRNNETEDEISSDSIPEDSEENKTESFAEEPLIKEEDHSEDPSNDSSDEIEVTTNSSDAEALIEDEESSDIQIIENPGKEKSENNDTEPLTKREKEDLNPMPKECEEIIGDTSISEPLVDKDDSSEDQINEMDTLITDDSEDTIEEITNDEPLIEEEDPSTNTMNSEENIIETTIKDQILQELITENSDESTNDSPIAGLLLSEEDSTSIEIITEDTSVEPLVQEVESITNICDEKLAKPASSVQLVKEYDNAFDQTSESFEDIKTETTSLEIFHEDKSFNETTDYFEESKLGLLLDDNEVSANSVTKKTEENGKEGSSSKSKNEEDSSDTTNNHVDESSNENNLDDSNTEPLDNNDDDNENNDDDNDDKNEDEDDQDENHADSIPEDSKNDETDSIKTELLLVVSNESLTDEMIFSCDLSTDDEDPGLQKGDDEDPDLQKGNNELFDSDIAIVNDVLEKIIDEIAEDETQREGNMEAERELCFSPCLIDPESILEENTDSQSSPEHPPQVHIKLNVKIREELRKGKEDIAMVYAIEERTTGKKINNEQRVYIDVQEADGETVTHSIDIKQADEYLAPFIGPHAEDDIPCEENIGDEKTDERCEGSIDDKGNVDTSFEEIMNTEDVDGSTKENKEEINGTKRSDKDVKEDDSDPLTEQDSKTKDTEHNVGDLVIASEEERAASVTDQNDTKTPSTTDEEKLVLRDISHNEEDLIIASSLPEELELVSVINSILESIEENQKVDDTTKENEKVDDTTKEYEKADGTTKENENTKSKIQSDESVSKSDEGATTRVLTVTNNTTNIPPEGDNLDDLVDEEESILIPLTEVQVTLAYNDIVRLDADKTTNNLESAENYTDIPNQNPQTSVPSQPRRKVYYPEKYPNYNPTPPPSPVYQPNQIKRSKKLFPPIPKPVSYHAEYINTNKNPRVLRRGPNQSKSADITTYTYKGSISSVVEFVSERKTQFKKANIEDQNIEEQKNTDVQNDTILIDEILGNSDSIEIDDNKNEDGENKSTKYAKDQDPDLDDESLSAVDNKEPENNNNQKRLEENEENEENKENDETVNEGERVITHEERIKRRKYLEEQKQDEEPPFTGEKVISAEDRRLRRLQLIKVE